MARAGWDPEEVRLAASEPLGFRQERAPFLAPHFCDHVLAELGPERAHGTVLYALAIELGDAPSSVAYDVALDRSVLARAHNADGKERGPVRYRDALGSSLNLAALDVALRRVGIDR
jgi:membrane carboxypeptidase/penicillin-binding protein